MFLSNNEKKISEMYLKKGFVLHNINNLEDLHWIRNAYLEIIQKNIPKIKKKNNSNVFDNIHKYIKSSKLNTFRLDVINQIHKKKDFRELIYSPPKRVQILDKVSKYLKIQDITKMCLFRGGG